MEKKKKNDSSPSYEFYPQNSLSSCANFSAHFPMLSKFIFYVPENVAPIYIYFAKVKSVRISVDKTKAETF